MCLCILNMESPEGLTRYTFGKKDCTVTLTEGTIMVKKTKINNDDSEEESLLACPFLSGVTIAHVIWQRIYTWDF